MNRRFNESQLATAPTADVSAAPSLPGFVACSVNAIPVAVQQMWHAIYQVAYTQALMKAALDSQPTRYQRLVYQICLN